jgi:hypothetical protein
MVGGGAGVSQEDSDLFRRLFLGRIPGVTQDANAPIESQRTRSPSVFSVVRKPSMGFATVDVPGI